MDNSSKIKGIIFRFCDCILDEELENVYFGITDLGKSFCDSYNYYFYLFSDIEQSTLDLYVKQSCVDKFSELISHGLAPQQFYSKDQACLLLDELENYSLKKYNRVFPKCFRYINDIISLYCREFQNLSYFFGERINSYVARELDKVLDEKIKYIDNKAKEVSDNIGKLNNRINKAEKKTVETCVTVLGVFSAVVLTFNAGVSFSSVILENLITSSIYRAILITLILGLILGNVIFGLFAYLEYVRKNHTEDNGNKSNIKLPLIIMNAILVTLMVVTVLFWHKGFVETRDIEVNRNSAASLDEAEYTTHSNDESTIDYYIVVEDNRS